MSPIQQMLLGVGAVATKTYVDDIFSTFVYAGNSTARSINNGLDLAGEGGMLWVKRRNQSEEHIITDTARGAANYIASSNSDGSNSSSGITSFNSTGFSLGTVNHVNGNNYTYVSWAFRKAPGFCDIIEFSGTGSAQTINHNLGCIPGLILIKRTDDSANWSVYHRDLGNTKRLILNETDAASTATTLWDSTSPTATTFRVGPWSDHNASGSTNIAYLFAGGESDAATARSVDFDGTGDKLSIANHADLQIGSSTYTMEFWVYKNADTPDNFDVWVAKGSNSNDTREFAIESFTDQRLEWWYATSGNSWSYFEVADNIPTGQWTHICAQKDSNGYFSFFVNGTRTYYSTTGGETLNTGADPFCIGGYADANPALESNVKISNFRFIKGTALYSSSFKPSTEPLTNVTNTKLLCCNDSSITGSTVTPSTISSVGSPTASTDSPFDDPAGFVFGESGSESIIKCGSYHGNNTSNGPEIYLGWEPQWVLVKTLASGNWRLLDSMRGIVTGGADPELEPNSSSSEDTGNNRIAATPTGFKVDTASSSHNDNNEYIYIAIRRSDGYVGKPPELGTDVFGIGTRSGSSSNALSNVNVFTDFSIIKRYNNSGEYWATNARLMGKYSLQTNSSDAQLTGALPTSGGVWDHMAGHLVAASNGATNSGSDIIDYGWKRHAGMDVVCYDGNSVSGTQISHSLNAVPQMIWIKRRDDTKDWTVGHHGANGGTNPWNYYLELNQTQAEASQEGIWNNTAPTSSHFTLGNWTQVNNSSGEYIAMLFASTDVSKVGFWVGNNTNNRQITTGFQPRFLIVFLSNQGGGYDWQMLDSTRGFISPNSNILKLNSTAAQSNQSTYFTPTSTGFTITESSFNGSGQNWIYYAHA